MKRCYGNLAEAHISIYGTAWCEETTYIRRALTQWGVAHRYVDVEREPFARRKVMLWNFGCLRTAIVALGPREQDRVTAPDQAHLEAFLHEHGLIRVGPVVI